MICQECKNEISDQYYFCPYCGEKQRVRSRVCPKCGLIAFPRDEKCEGCGYVFFEDAEKKDEAGDVNGKKGGYEDEDDEAEEETEGVLQYMKKDKKVLLLVGAFLVILLIVGTLLIMLNTAVKERKVGTGEKVQMEVVENPSTKELSEVTYNLFESRAAELKGTLETIKDTQILRLYEPVSVFSATADAEKKVLLKNVTEIGLRYDKTKMKPEQLAALTDQTPLRMKGNLSIIDGKVWLFPNAFAFLKEEPEASSDTAKESKSLAGVEQNVSQTAALDSPEGESSKTTADSTSLDYILPNSSTEKLSMEQIANLSLQQLNYAKNEIYARHGRKFLSEELQQYFDSKSWYHGTIAPDDFSDTALSALEIENIDFLREREYALNSGGYSLQ